MNLDNDAGVSSAPARATVIAEGTHASPRDVAQADDYAAASAPTPAPAGPSPSASRYLRPNQAALLLGVTPHAIRRALREGRLRGRKIGGRWRVLASAIAIRREEVNT